MAMAKQFQASHLGGESIPTLPPAPPQAKIDQLEAAAWRAVPEKVGGECGISWRCLGAGRELGCGAFAGENHQGVSSITEACLPPREVVTELVWVRLGQEHVKLPR